MPKLSTVKAQENIPLDLEKVDLLDEVFPDTVNESSSVKYPKVVFSLVAALLFILLSQPMITRFIIAVTPSFKERPYLALLVKAAVFMAIIYILLRSKYFNDM